MFVSRAESHFSGARVVSPLFFKAIPFHWESSSQPQGSARVCDVRRQETLFPEAFLKYENDHPRKERREQHQRTGSQCFDAKDRCKRVPHCVEENGNKDTLCLLYRTPSNRCHSFGDSARLAPIHNRPIPHPSSNPDCPAPSLPLSHLPLLFRSPSPIFRHPSSIIHRPLPVPSQTTLNPPIEWNFFPARSSIDTPLADTPWDSCPGARNRFRKDK
jgi:hypothetical protein